jgi:dynein heavy chain
MLVGNAGTGKTVLMGDKLNGLSEDFMVTNIPFNFYTTSEMLQRTLEKPLEKKAGRNFGPPGTRRLIYFVDDMNMPEVVSTAFSTSHVSKVKIFMDVLVFLFKYVIQIDFIHKLNSQNKKL